jgi:hypothetical protein
MKLIRRFLNIFIFCTGFIALLWFLIRVIPKPSRAAYPCQQAAFPIASAFILWLTGSLLSIKLVKIARVKLFHGKVIIGLFLIAGGIGLFSLLLPLGQMSYVWAGQMISSQHQNFEPIDQPNEVIGDAQGIFPGRVVWCHDTTSVFWNGESTREECDGISSATSCWTTSNAWWKNMNWEVVKSMLQESLFSLTGNQDPVTAWDSVFCYYNRKHNRGHIGYQNGEKIAIKINMNTVGAHNDESNACYVSPALIYAMLEQLVVFAGIEPENITFYDISRPVPSTIFDTCTAAFPGVRFVDVSGDNGREKFILDDNVRVQWSQELSLEQGGGHPTYLPKCVTEAQYLINMANLKGHSLAGVTMCAKNHLGTICTKLGGSAPQKAGVHPYIAAYDFGNPEREGQWDFYGREMGTYNPLVDLMGHSHLGEKTILFVVDAFYTVASQNNSVSKNDKWQMKPFNNEWPSSLFISQDGVAIESVGLDFLRSESSQYNVKGNVDNYLHEAALAFMPPSSTFYDPDGNGKHLKSLGVHEHWNNPEDKQYSRNLGIGNGIELVYLNELTTKTENSDMNLGIRVFPNPVSQVLFIELENHYRGKLYNTIHDMNGKVCHSYTGMKTESGFRETIFVQELNSGTYILQVNTGSHSTSQVVIIQNQTP